MFYTHYNYIFWVKELQAVTWKCKGLHAVRSITFVTLQTRDSEDDENDLKSYAVFKQLVAFIIIKFSYEQYWRWHMHL